MKLTNEDHVANAQDWLGVSQDFAPDEKVDRGELATQMRYTEADKEDVEIIADLIERFAREGR